MPKGLTNEEVKEKIRLGKTNKLNSSNRSIREILLTNLFTPFNNFFFVIISILIFFYFRTSEIKLLLDGWGVISIVFINTLIAIFQEIRAKRMLDKVQLLVNRDISVVRDSEIIKVNPSNLVEGDTIFIERGDQIPADGKIIEHLRLEIDESLLTGESESILKEDNDQVLSGSFVVSGNGYFIAEKLGNDSFAGKITGLAKNFKYIVSPLQKIIIRIIQILSFTALTLIIIKAFNNIDIGILSVSALRQYTTIIVSLIPSGLIFLTTITYVIGIYRISKLGAVVQRINAIEAFAGINVVCMDKTGTLTKNLLSITNQINISGLDDAEVNLIIGTYAKYTSYKNSTIIALSKYDSLNDVKVLDEIPFSSQTKKSAVKLNIHGKERIFVLGAFDLLKKLLRQEPLTLVNEDEIDLFRNLLLIEIVPTNKKLEDELIKPRVIPIAVISLLDTVRKDSKKALDLFNEKNIEVKILSGDSASAIQAIARKISWDIKNDEIITGQELEKMEEKAFNNAVVAKKVFARLAPDQKKQIVDTLKKKRLYTAMIGDGVNDLPAIKHANLGLAMEEGSQVTKEIADIILVKNKFSLLPGIFDEGNKIVNSVSMASKLFLTKNIFVALITILSIFSLPFILTPRRVGFITIFIITLPAFILSLNNKDVSKHRGFIKDLIVAVLISSICIVITGYSSYFLSKNIFPGNTEDIYSMIFICVVIFLALVNYLSIVIPNNKDNKSKIIFTVYCFGILGLLFATTILDLTQTPLFWFNLLYEISPLTSQHWLFILAAGCVGGLILYLLQEIRKAVMKI